LKIQEKKQSSLISIGFQQNRNMFSHPNSSSSKRKPFVDLTNVYVSSDNEETLKSDKKYENMDMMPLISHEKAVTTDIVDDTRFQNVHPLLGWYKHVNKYWNSNR
jgi:hypothetical protein